MLRASISISALLVGYSLFAETRTVQPERYFVTFSASHAPVARLRPGDTVITKTLDSRGRDETGKLILDADNVLTEPFYIEGAQPGDTPWWCGSIEFA
jgi:hypothetical protein